MSDPEALADRIEKAAFIIADPGRGWEKISDDERDLIVRTLRRAARVERLAPKVIALLKEAK